LYPFDTGYGNKTSDAEIKDKLDAAQNAGVNTVIFYIDDEQTYSTFVDDAGFEQTVSRVQLLVNEAHSRGLKAISYLNGLEAISVGAKKNMNMPTLARQHPDWLQKDITGQPMVFMTDSNEASWIPPYSEDAWASPFSPWRGMFKNRLASLGSTGLDGVYIDVTALPGSDQYGVKWGSSDPYFAAAFRYKYGIDIPAVVDWNSENWRKFVYFRHEAVRDYLGELADATRNSGMVPFFEISSNDGPSGTFLGNDNQFTISGGIACSPEIETDGNYFEAYRMSKATRDANQSFPMLYLGWSGQAGKNNATYAAKEFAITVSHSGNYYPTKGTKIPDNAFRFLDALQAPVLNKRVPYQNTALIYPMRSKDNTFAANSTLSSYKSAFQYLEEKHIPFRIIPLETMTAADLQDIHTIVLAGAESISDAEYDLIRTHTVSLVDANGTNDEWGNARSTPLLFPNAVNLSSQSPGLPFTITAPSTTFLEYYTDASNPKHYFLFAYNDSLLGNMEISSPITFAGSVYERNNTYNVGGTEITVPIKDYLEVIDISLTNEK
jgi:hypothetical protein